MSWLTVSTPLLRKDQLYIQFEGVTETLMFILSLILCEETLIRMSLESTVLYMSWGKLSKSTNIYSTTATNKTTVGVKNRFYILIHVGPSLQ